MNTKTLEGKFEQTKEFQDKYDTIVAFCDKEGTMIAQDRYLERDQDIYPFRFFRKGTIEYVFPKQNAKLKTDNSKVIDPHPCYTLRTEVQTFEFNEKTVKGRILVEYQDAYNVPILKVTDILENSELPEKIKKTIEEIFKGPQQP